MIQSQAIQRNQIFPSMSKWFNAVYQHLLLALINTAHWLSNDVAHAIKLMISNINLLFYLFYLIAKKYAYLYKHVCIYVYVCKHKHKYVHINRKRQNWTLI